MSKVGLENSTTQYQREREREREMKRERERDGERERERSCLSSHVQDGPPANSFTSPRKTGWLTKHGGHGIGANWKKRWFILDNHYLFYYKGQNVR